MRCSHPYTCPICGFCEKHCTGHIGIRARAAELRREAFNPKCSAGAMSTHAGGIDACPVHGKKYGDCPQLPLKKERAPLNLRYPLHSEALA